MISVNQESGYNLTGCLWFKVSRVCSYAVSGAAASSKGSTGQGESTFKPTHVVFGSPLSLVLCPWAGLSHDITAGSSMAENIRKGRERDGNRLFTTESWRWHPITFALFCLLGLTQTKGKVLYGMWITAGRNHQRPSCRLLYTCHLLRENTSQVLVK